MSTSPNKRARLDDSKANDGPSPARLPRPQVIMVSSVASAKKTHGTPRTRRVYNPRTPSSAKGTSKTKAQDETPIAAPSFRTPSRNTRSSRIAPPTESDEDENEDEDGSQRSGEEGETDDEDGEDDNPTISPLKSRPNKASAARGVLQLPALGYDSAIRRTSSDVYFHLSSKPSKTSDNVFSALLPRLTPEECLALMSNSPAATKNAAQLAQLRSNNESHFDQYLFELGQGFNLLFYGYGSKRSLLNHFAATVCAKRGHVAILNGFFPTFNLHDMIDQLERIPGVFELPASSTPGIDGQFRRIYDFFLPSNAARPDAQTSRRPLFLVIHNIEGQNLRGARARMNLALLASNPRIHVIASIDNVHAPIMWTTDDILNRKHEVTNNSDIPSSRGFAWLWHEATTFEHYDVELSSRDLSALPRAGKSGDDGGVVITGGANGGAPAPINETAAKQVLASVTQKAKRLFNLLGRQQLAAWEEQGGVSGNSLDGLHVLGMAYDLLSLKAREDFMAANDVALRGLLQEFRDHGLVRSTSVAAQDGKAAGDVLWIPLAKDTLSRLLEDLKT